ncbi:TRAP transporter small permease [Azonexus sp.]|uniref:TRAP transporter small permease n=1 Tax=Azonexus sp. TaxID=1872668 RepID=UPI0035B10850
MAEVMDEPRTRKLGAVGRMIEKLCQAMAIMAGAAFVIEMLLSAVSVLMRMVIGRGIGGDFELVQVLSAVGIALCLPYCQFHKGHVFVDFFTLWAPASLKRLLDAIGALLLALSAFFLAWRIGDGMSELREYGEASMVLNLPIWWGYVPVVLAFVMLGIAALHTGYGELLGERDE